MSGISLQPGQNPAEYLFGERQTGLSGYIYRDGNNNGQREPGEPGIPNALVILTGTTPGGAPVEVIRLSNAAGFYSFGNPVTGTLRISALQPAGYLDGLEQVGVISNVLRGTAGNDFIDLTYNDGDFGVDYNFGELSPASVSGLVYFDIDGSGLLNGVEPTLQLAQITLRGLDDRSQTVSVTQISNPSGQFAFGGLRPGVYTLTEVTPPGYTDGIDQFGSAGGTLVPSDTIAAIVLAPGASASGYLFGEQLNGISGYVYADANANGVRNGENGIPQVTLILTGMTTLSETVIRVQQTDANGFYAFGEMAPGTYRVRELQAGGYVDGSETPGLFGGSPGGPGADHIDFAYPGGYGDGYNFGELLPARLLGYAFWDVIEDGKFEWGGCPAADGLYTNGAETACFGGRGIEEGIPGVSVVLTGLDDLGQSLRLTATTDGNGRYEFGLLRSGVYAVLEFQRDIDLDGPDRAWPSGAATVSNDFASGFSLLPGETKGAVFGEKPSLTGYVYRDDNDNGVREPDGSCLVSEPGIGQTSVQLTGIDLFGNLVNRTRTTTGRRVASAVEPADGCHTGLFWFGGLVTGTYALQEMTQPAGFFDGRESVGALGGLTSTNDLIDRIELVAPVFAPGYLFGELRSGVGGYVYLDKNNNGLREPELGEGDLGEPASIFLTGLNDLGQTISQSLQTTGGWSFTSLRAGVYTITELQPGGYTDGAEQAGIGAPILASSNDQFVIQLASGAQAQEFNFGETILSRLSGRVAFVPFENLPSGYAPYGLNGVVVALGGPSGVVTASTEGGGYFEFGGLIPGVYSLTQNTLPLGYVADGAQICKAGALAGTSGDPRARALRNISLQFGDVIAGCDLRNGPVLSGTVYADHNDNGAQDAGEPGISGAGLTLLGTTSTGGLVTQTFPSSGPYPAGVIASYNLYGRWAFGGLLTGTYRVQESPPSGYYDGKDAPGTLGGTAYTETGSVDVIAGIAYTPNLIAQRYLFGELAPAVLRGMVFNDQNASTLFEFGEPGIVADVIARGIDDLGQSVWLTFTTNAPYGSNLLVGEFAFSLRQGVYTLTELQPSGYTDGYDTLGSAGGLLGNDQMAFISVGWGQQAYGYNFGERQSGIVALVYDDRDGDGAYYATGFGGYPMPCAIRPGFRPPVAQCRRVDHVHPRHSPEPDDGRPGSCHLLRPSRRDLGAQRDSTHRLLRRARDHRHARRRSRSRRSDRRNRHRRADLWQLLSLRRARALIAERLCLCRREQQRRARGGRGRHRRGDRHPDRHDRLRRAVRGGNPDQCQRVLQIRRHPEWRV
ncbi:MAG: hypothetical protein IPO29_01550 [Anaerolineae bacterium]|nr:hypothetical protein [Anaerolineae bacterium]